MAKRELIKSILDRVKKIIGTNEETKQKGNNDMNKKELILKTLEKMGHSPEVDNDGDIMLHYQMKAIYVMTGDKDEPYISMMLPQFHEIEDGNLQWADILRMSTSIIHDKDILMLQQFYCR